MQLRGRVAEIRTRMKDPALSMAQTSTLDSRRRLLLQEIYEQEQIIQNIRAYLPKTRGAAKGGDAACTA